VQLRVDVVRAGLELDRVARRAGVDGALDGGTIVLVVVGLGAEVGDVDDGHELAVLERFEVDGFADDLLRRDVAARTLRAVTLSVLLPNHSPHSLRKRRPSTCRRGEFSACARIEHFLAKTDLNWGSTKRAW
jgi:hypothetical protein